MVISGQTDVAYSVRWTMIDPSGEQESLNNGILTVDPFKALVAFG
jgi:hypothetical protein